jgi:signal transduction histidine kinase
MVSNHDDYLLKLLNFSQEVEGMDVRFVDKNIENFFTKVTYEDDMKKSKAFTILLNAIYLSGIIISVIVNESLNRTTFIFSGLILLDLVLYIISQNIRNKYALYKVLKYIRFLIVFASSFLIVLFKVNPDKLSYIRGLYMIFMAMSLLFTYFVEFSYFMIILIPCLNSIGIIVAGNLLNIDHMFLLPELIVNLVYYYAMFVTKKYEFLRNKKLFFESYKNEQYIKYIKQLINVINTHVICISKDRVLFMNDLAKKLFQNCSDQLKTEQFINFKENESIFRDEEINPDDILDRINLFFKHLKLNSSDSSSNTGNRKTLYDSLSEFFKDDEQLNQEFTRIGYFTNEQHSISYDVCLRKMNFKEEVVEIFLYDISDIKQAESIKIEAKYKKRILAKIAHEFKTPLISIISLIKKITRHKNEMIIDKKIDENLLHIENLSNHTLVLINDIIQYVSESGQLKFVKKEIFIRKIVEFSYNVLETLVQCDENKVNVVNTFIEIDREIDKYKVISDESRLKQIMLNFVSNAYKFTLNGFIKIHAKFFNEENVIELSVQDTGFGIKKEKHQNVFQEFTQFNIDPEYNNKGSGLGLSICKTLSKALNHQIGFTSIYGKGSKFFIQIKCISFDEMDEKFNRSMVNVKKSITNTFNECNNLNTIRSEIVNEKRKNIGYIEENLNNFNNEEDDVQTITKRFFYNKNFMKDDDKQEKNEENFINCSLGENVSSNYNFAVVVIDDQKLVRENTMNLINISLESLKISDFTILEGSDGIELLNILRLDRENKIKFVFVDEYMEYLNGSEVITIIRKLEEAHKFKRHFIVSLTAMEDESFKNRIIKIGADLIISKPCITSDIVNIFKLRI